MNNKTIYALSSGALPAGVAVIRVSGAKVQEIMKSLCGLIVEPRLAKLFSLSHPTTGNELDRGLVLYFKGPHSFTGEDVLELQLHGGPAVVEAVFDALQTFDDVEMAEAGEFTRRAFENGKLDLVEIEGLSDLIIAETEAQRAQAMGSASGAVSLLYDGWRDELIQAIALIESALDFSDEEDVPEDVILPSFEIVSRLRGKIEAHLDDQNKGEILRHGFRVVIVGAPNVGKSSLLNRLARRDVAIVSDEEGTTRDVISVHLDLDGYAVIVSDTAGIRETSSKVEQEGIKRSFQQASLGELVIWLCDVSDESEPQTFAQVFSDQSGVLNVPVLRVWNKADLSKNSNDINVLNHDASEDYETFHHIISVSTGEGLDELVDEIGKRVKQRIGSGERLSVTRQRHRELLEHTVRCLSEFIDGEMSETELRAEDLRRAAVGLGRITGKLDVEEVLDKIFAEFCIGK